jgi:hypothetical protein
MLFLPYFLFFLYVSIHKGDVSRYNTDTDLSIRSLSGHHDPIVMQGLRHMFGAGGAAMARGNLKRRSEKLTNP